MTVKGTGMSTATIVIGPEHHGQRMSLEEFADAEGREGCLYELSRGVVTVIDVPNEPHFDFLDAIQDQLRIYKASHPGEIFRILEGSSAKIPVESLNSERHPDLLVYKARRQKNATGSRIWSVWVPEIVVEIVSAGSEDRDYNQKPEEYLQFGVKEYWIIDAAKNLMTVHQRSGEKWDTRTVSPPANYSTHLLPDFEFDLQRVFDAAKQ